MKEITRRKVLALGAAAAAGVYSKSAEAATGSVTMTVTSGGFIVGAGGGSGVLIFHGVQYPFNVSGMSFGATIGFSQAQFIGRAYHLNRPSDIEGAYSAAGANLAVAGGGGVAELSNGRGVVLRLKSRQVGFKLSLAMSGLSISLR